MTDDIEEFGEDIASTRMDTKMEWAEVVGADPMTREEFDEDIGPGHADAKDEGLFIQFRMASGDLKDEWFRKPNEWDIIASNLVLLLKFWELHPGDLDKLNSNDESFELPMRYESGEGQWQPDWRKIEQTVHTRSLEEDDDA